MDHYIDLTIRPDPEFPAHQLMSALYAKLHRALVNLYTDCIGVSFPGFNTTPVSIGMHLRLHGSLSSLRTLMETNWLLGMRDHASVTDIQAIPGGAGHRRVFRVQAQSSPERLRRRAMRRHGLSEDDARARIPEAAGRTLKLPFVQLSSRSTGQLSFPLFIEHGPIEQQPVSGRFNSYGLSREATIPWF
ncbi:type I-F CRISPR-associated endoribonuclease Cas6/Csy4 [Dokdonella koreensis]|uniref:CRISPR-associated protein, Csy4 family n=1 Tax=Dokdonella koreensis DS-123 TaxID=1300342 RepID=A0A160DVH7_9GAMM|nr:type I-F CRISPR-associated endoribonuclease Cas6/Csy4 [Dokdonella koreensis]ANB17783.1 CRISPR-associated protein, Csy4 family [Dokdonella koreensis DS-123]